MKLTTILATLAAALLLGSSAFALSVPSDGSDGNFNPVANIQVDLSQAVTGTWSANNSANTGLGIYDPTQWAVVFKYASVNIPAGVTVTFKNHPSHAPVVWLVSGNVTIAGTVNVDGQNGTNNTILSLIPTEPGPGGFRGGAIGPSGMSAGNGPGGGVSAYGATNPGTYANSYGNPQVTPLIGGSGGAAGSGWSGGGGGGAILIVAGSSINLTGLIDARGGVSSGGANGSGGAIRLIADQVLGNGNVTAVDTGIPAGRIRIETPLLSPALLMAPATIAVPPASPPIIWPAANAPTAVIASVDGVGAPADPDAPLLSTSDVAIQNNNPVQVVIQTTNFSTSGTVQLRASPKFGGGAPAIITAVFSTGTFTAATWVATLPFSAGFATLQAIATSP